MTALSSITISFLIYPVLGYLIIRYSQAHPKKQIRILLSLCLLSVTIIVFAAFRVITRYEGLNWFLITIPYLTLSALLWKTQRYEKLIINVPGMILMILIFGVGYIASSIGFFFTLLAANDLDTDNSKWISKDLIYKERNIGQGPDPEISQKQIEVYKTINWFPLLATRIMTKTYDTWKVTLQQNLSTQYDKDNKVLYLFSSVKRYGVWEWSDTLELEKHYR